MKETIKNSNKINILIWMIFIIIPISITILFIYLFAKFIYPMIDSVISTFDVSFTCSLSWIIIILFIPIIFLEILILFLNSKIQSNYQEIKNKEVVYRLYKKNTFY